MVDIKAIISDITKGMFNLGYVKQLPLEVRVELASGHHKVEDNDYLNTLHKIFALDESRDVKMALLGAETISSNVLYYLTLDKDRTIRDVALKKLTQHIDEKESDNYDENGFMVLPIGLCRTIISEINRRRRYNCVYVEAIADEFKNIDEPFISKNVFFNKFLYDGKVNLTTEERSYVTDAIPSGMVSTYEIPYFTMEYYTSPSITYGLSKFIDTRLDLLKGNLPSLNYIRRYILTCLFEIETVFFGNMQTIGLKYFIQNLFVILLSDEEKYLPIMIDILSNKCLKYYSIEEEIIFNAIKNYSDENIAIFLQYKNLTRGMYDYIMSRLPDRDLGIKVLKEAQYIDIFTDRKLSFYRYLAEDFSIGNKYNIIKFINSIPLSKFNLLDERLNSSNVTPEELHLELLKIFAERFVSNSTIVPFN